MDNKNENGLVINQPNQLQADIFGGEQRVKKATSLDINVEEEAAVDCDEVSCNFICCS